MVFKSEHRVSHRGDDRTRNPNECLKGSTWSSQRSYLQRKKLRSTIMNSHMQRNTHTHARTPLKHTQAHTYTHCEHWQTLFDLEIEIFLCETHSQTSINTTTHMHTESLFSAAAKILFDIESHFSLNTQNQPLTIKPQMIWCKNLLFHTQSHKKPTLTQAHTHLLTNKDIVWSRKTETRKQQ